MLQLLPRFEGLWLCRRTAPDEDGVTFRHALLFANRGAELYLIRFNHSDVDADGITIHFDYDYKLSLGVIHQHPIGYPEKFRVDLRWSAQHDGALALQYPNGRTDRFYPSSWDQLFSLGFERDEIEEALNNATKAGWSYSPAARFPEVSGSKTGSH